MMQVTPTVLSLLSAVAYAILVASGVLLWRQARSLATAMVAIGFAIILLDQLVLLVSYLRLSARVLGHPGDTLFIIYHRANSLRVASFGVWVAAVGLLWHALQGAQRKRVSPDNAPRSASRSGHAPRGLETRSGK